MLAFLTEGKNKYKNLRLFNLVMGFFHLVQAGIMLSVSNDFSINLNTSFLTSQFEGDNLVFQSAPENIISLNLGAAVAIFLLLSAVAHFLLASPLLFGWYRDNLEKKINYARWYEYALSSSLMIVVVGALVGFFDAPGLLLLFTLNAMMNLFGLLMEKMNSMKSGNDVDWTAFIFGCIAGAIPWIIIAWYFISAVEGFDPGENGNPVPDFVYAILASIFVFFNCFAINMFLQYKKIGPWKNYLFGEAMYIVLSLVAKSALAWQVWSGTLRGD